VVRKYPTSEYSVSAKAKLEGARDQLAGKEMDIGRYYMENRDYTAAINRFKTVVTRYQTTRHVEEALARLTEAYMAIGIVGEAQTAAAVLGHNFPDSPWYKDAYNLVKSGGSRAEREIRAPIFPGPSRNWDSARNPLSMLARLSIRDIVLIERLDIEFFRGLAVLTGETGAGKSILLDAFALALGGRGDASLVRHGAEQGQVTAVFDVPIRPSGRGHPFRERPRRGEFCRFVRNDPAPRAVGRRRTRAFINDQAISVQTLKAVAQPWSKSTVSTTSAPGRRRNAPALARCLCRAREGRPGPGKALGGAAHGQQRARGTPRRHGACGARGGLPAPCFRRIGGCLRPRTARKERACGTPYRDDAGREDRRQTCARRRTRSRAIIRRSLRSQRRCGAWSAARPIRPRWSKPAVKAIDAAINALEEADQHLSRALAAADFDPGELERIEERACSRCAPLPANIPLPSTGWRRWPRKYAADVALIDAGADATEKIGSRRR